MAHDYGKVSDSDYSDAAKEGGIEPDYALVGRYVTDRRKELELQGITLAELIRRSGVSAKTWKRLSDGQRVVQPAKLAAMSRALDWTPESIAALRYGSEPIASTDDEQGLQMQLFNRLAQLGDKMRELEEQMSRLDARLARITREPQ